MIKSESIQGLCVIVVGNSRDQLIQYVINLVGGYEVEFSCCDDIYTAVIELAKKTGSNCLVIGRLSDLSKEKGRFLEKTSEKGFGCCCLADKKFTEQQFKISDVNRTHTFIVNEPTEIERVVKTFLPRSGAQSANQKKINGSSDFMKDEFRTTEAELDALLGA